MIIISITFTVSITISISISISNWITLTQLMLFNKLNDLASLQPKLNWS